MLRNYFLVTWRNLFKNKIFILINILGMSIAIACAIVAYLNWDFNHSFDKNHISAKSIYRVQAWQDTPDGRKRFAVVPTPLGNIARQNLQDIESVVRYTTAKADVRIGNEVFNTSISYADSAFFKLFTFELIDGDFSAFSSPKSIFLSEKLALKYFNSTRISGTQITKIHQGKLSEFTIGGVFKDQPMNSSFPFEAITLFANYSDVSPRGPQFENDWHDLSTLFVKISNRDEATRIEKQLQGYLSPQNKANEDFQLSEYYLQNFETLASSFYGETWLNDEQLRWGNPPSAILGPVFMSFFLLLLACFNFTNTSLSASGKRLKEIGIRKTMGGVRIQLVMQFLNENIILCFLSFGGGLLLAEFLVPAYNALWPGIKLTLNYSENLPLFGFLTILLFFTAIVSGMYPAMYLSSFKPASILKGNLKLSGTNWLSRTLLTLQFSVALICIVSGIAFFRNSNYQNEYDLGYARTGIITVPIANKHEFETYRDALAVNKDIEIIGGSKNHVSDRYYEGTVTYESVKHQVEIIDIGSGYLSAMNIVPVEGRPFDELSATDLRESVLVSEAFVKSFGLEGAIGKRLLLSDTLQLYIVGVVKNVHTDGFWKPAAPVMIRYTSPDQYTQLVVKTRPEKISQVNSLMKDTWQQISPNTVYAGKITDGNVQTAKMINNNTISIFGFLGISALVMSVTGLYALISLNIAKRMKEIGVRKILGASPAHIARVINLEFICLLIVASAIGGSLGYLISEKMMDAIWEYYIRSGALTVGLAIALLFLVAGATIFYKTFIAAALNSTVALKGD